MTGTIIEVAPKSDEVTYVDFVEKLHEMGVFEKFNISQITMPAYSFRTEQHSSRKMKVFASTRRDGAKTRIAKHRTSKTEGITNQIFSIGFSGFFKVVRNFQAVIFNQAANFLWRALHLSYFHLLARELVGSSF